LRSVSNIVCSDSFTLCLNNDLNVVSFGRSTNGSHGHKEDNVFPPKIISSLNHIISISTFGGHCVCLDNDGNVSTFGSNQYGQLGIGNRDTLKYTSIPQKVNLPPCIQISCGGNFTMCLSESGEIYSFGNNETGQLGLGNNENYYSPQLISSLKDVEFIECGYSYTFCKTLNNEIFCWGYNCYGALGLDNTKNQKTPILCSSVSNEDVIDIKCGNAHTLVLTSNEGVLSSGYNYYGQIGRKCGGNYSSSFQKIEDLSEITRIECGKYHSLCIDINNNLYVFGFNQYGQLGLDDTDDRDKPIKHPSLSNIIDISKGGYQTFVQTSNNEIYAFGENNCSQLGITTEDYKQITPIRVFEDNEDIWFSNINKSKTKSARSVINTTVSNEKLDTAEEMNIDNSKKTELEPLPNQNSEIKSKQCCVIH